jgi:hypothetical protein
MESRVFPPILQLLLRYQSRPETSVLDGLRAIAESSTNYNEIADVWCKELGDAS